ncbi:hypothetical protein ACWEQ0_17570 [Nocardia thailandica]|uniref:ESX-1 secretion-associated protein EspA/EspE-like domain-containing protein n=1 Tax=Nocardia thailandica TaxID=257275 RepID=A0ABW6PN77_9NOCA
MADGPNAVGRFLNESMPPLPGTIDTFDDAEAPRNDLLRGPVNYRDNYYQEDIPVLKGVGLPGVDEKGDADAGYMKGVLIGDVWENGYGLVKTMGSGSTMDKVDAIAKAGGTGKDVFDAASTVFKLASGTTTTLGKFDPFNLLGSQLMSWMLEHVEPLRKTLESVSGSPDMVQAYSDSWTAIAEHLTATAAAWAKALDTGIGEWTGATADAYRTRATELTGKIAEKAAIAQALSDCNAGMKKVVEAVKAIITEILCNLAGMLAEITALLIVSGGTASPALIARALLDISLATASVGKLVYQLVDAIVSLKAALQNIVRIIRGVTEVETAK